MPAPIEHTVQAGGGRDPLRGLVLRAGGVGMVLERDKGVRWMPWRQEAMKDVARCEKPRGDASDR